MRVQGGIGVAEWLQRHPIQWLQGARPVHLIITMIMGHHNDNGGAWAAEAQGVHHAPCTLYTMHPAPSIPCTLHPLYHAPCTLYTLHPAPSIPCTLHPLHREPCTLCTMNHAPSAPCGV